MAWQRNYVVLTTGERVRYSFVDRGEDIYRVRFKGPFGKITEKSTGCSKKSDAMDVAHRIILMEFQQITQDSSVVTWELARSKLQEALEADALRPSTITQYLGALKQLAEMFPLARGPGDVSDRMANDFKTNYARGKIASVKKITEDTRKRSPVSTGSMLRRLKSVFGWLVKLFLVESNPFEKIKKPELDKNEVKFVKQDDISEFFSWIRATYPNWDLPVLFFMVKAVTACRLDDVCSLRSDQLQDGRLVFEAEQTKNRSERYAIQGKRLKLSLD